MSQIRFITVGDQHIKKLSASDKGNDRLKKIVDFANSSNVDFVVLLGDTVDYVNNEVFQIAKDIISGFKKPVYMLCGNHDLQNINGILVDNAFESWFGESEKVININEYQLIFVSIRGVETDINEDGDLETVLGWKFNFNKSDIDKKKATLVFIHGPVARSPISCGATVPCWADRRFKCENGTCIEKSTGIFTTLADCMANCNNKATIKKPHFFGYPKIWKWNDNKNWITPGDIRSDLGRFSKLLAVYSGHIHYEWHHIQDIGYSPNVHLITQDALIDASAGCCNNLHTDYVGYTRIENLENQEEYNFNYALINYTKPFKDPFPSGVVDNSNLLLLD